MTDTNLAIIPDDWEFYFSNVHPDPYVLHNGHPSFRIDAASSDNPEQQLYGPGHTLTIHPGDHIVLTCWMKTGPTSLSPNPYSGARIGMDLTNVAAGRGAYCCASIEAPTYPDTDAGIRANMVTWSSDWTQRIIDFIVPSDFFTVDRYTGNTVPSMQINHINMWAQVTSTGNLDTGQGWFSDAELYVNPSGPPPPVPPPATQYYTVNASAGAGGSASHSGSNQVLVGQNFSSTASANSNYVFHNWTLDGVVVGTNPTYTVTNGAANVTYTLTASFTYTPPPVQTFTVTISSTTGGTCTPTGTQNSNVGTPIAITAYALGGYTFSHFTRNGTVYSTTSPISISGYANQTITIRAFFEPNPPPTPPTPPTQTTYTVNVETSTGGFTDKTGVNTVDVGTNFVVTATAGANRVFDYWLQDSVYAGSNRVKTIAGVADATYDLQPIFLYIPPNPEPNQPGTNLPVLTQQSSLLFSVVIKQLENARVPTFAEVIAALEKVKL